MKKVLRIIITAVLLLSIVATLIACSDSNDKGKEITIVTKKDTPESTTTTAATNKTEDPEGTTLPATLTPPVDPADPDNPDNPIEYDYSIDNLEDLMKFMNTPDVEGDYVLTADIDFNDITNVATWNQTNAPTNIWTPVGNSGNPFTGTFDGQGHTINGLYIFGENKVGFFGALVNAKISNLVIGPGYISASAAVSGSVAALYHGTTEITNCINYASISSLTFAGGIVGKFLDSAGCDTKIIGCVNFGSVHGASTTSGVYVGGIVAHGVGVVIDQCANFGAISSGDLDTKAGAIVGGIAGVLGSSQGYAETISNSYNAGSVTATRSADNTNAAIGGLVGRMYESAGKIVNCYNTGTIYINGTALKQTAYLAVENTVFDYTENLYNSGKMCLIGTTTEVTPSYTEDGLVGTVRTGSSAVAEMQFDATIWKTTTGAPILNAIPEKYQPA